MHETNIVSRNQNLFPMVNLHIGQFDMRVLATLLVLVFGLSHTSSKWIKKYVENYHRPTYYNKGHSSLDHVDYNRTALEERDKPPVEERPTQEPFDALKHQSFYVSILHHGSVICAGALISRRMVVTSTVCFDPRQGQLLRV